MSSTRTAPRTNSSSTMNKTTGAFHAHHTNGSTNSSDPNDSTNTNELDSSSHRSSLGTKTNLQTDGIYRNLRFVHAVSVGLLGQQVFVQTNEHERYHGVLESISSNGDILLSVAHRLHNNQNNDTHGLPTTPIDLIDTIDGSAQTFELQKRTILGSNVVEIIAVDVDLAGQNKCVLDETPKVTQLEDERFNRMELFYGSDDIDPETLEDLELGDDGKAGYDPEDMFHTNREKFNTTTDFDESKYTNVPIRQMSPSELAEIEKKALEIEKGVRTDDVDEDDAGVKRPMEPNQSHHNDDGNSNMKNVPSSRSYPNDRRPDYRYESENNPSKRGNWRDQRPGGNSGNNRRGGPNNYPSNNSKQNQRSEQNSYSSSSRSSDQSTNNRQQQYNNRPARSNHFSDNRSPHEGRDSPSQPVSEEQTRGQRINSGSFSQGPISDATSPSTNVPARTIHSNNNRPQNNRNSPAPYSGSSSSRHSSTNTTSPTSNNYQGNTSATTNYPQQSNSKMTRKPSRNDSTYGNDETDSSKSQRLQQQQQPQQQQQQQHQPSQHQQTAVSSSNSGQNTVPLNRPSQLQTQHGKPPHQLSQQPHQPPMPTTNIPPPLTLPPHEDHPSSHESINTNLSDPSVHMNNPSAHVQSMSTSGAITTTGNTKAASDLNPEADEFVPGQPRESVSRPDSRGASISSVPMNPYMTHPQSMQMLQQPQQSQQQMQPLQMIPQTHNQGPGTMYPQFNQPNFSNIQTFVNNPTQSINVGMVGAPMMSQAQLTGNPSNPTNASAGGMQTGNPNSAPAYKTNANQSHSGDGGNSVMNNVAPKKAIVSVLRSEQPNNSQQQQQQQQQQVIGGTQIMYPQPAIRYYQQEYIPQQPTPQPMQFQQVPLYCPINPQGIIQAAGVGPPQNIMGPPGTPSAGPVTPGSQSFYYQNVFQDTRLLNMYPSMASVNPASVNSNWQMNRSPPHHQPQGQVTEQQRPYGGNPTGQNIVSQVPTPPTAPNSAGMVGRTASTSGPSGQNGNGGGPPMTPQYSLNGGIAATYAYGSANPWFSGPQPISSPQTVMPPQVNAFSMIFDQSQQPQLAQHPAFMHSIPYDPSYYPQIPQQPPSAQQGMDAAPQGNYNR